MQTNRCAYTSNNTPFPRPLENQNIEQNTNSSNQLIREDVEDRITTVACEVLTDSFEFEEESVDADYWIAHLEQKEQKTIPEESMMEESFEGSDLDYVDQAVGIEEWFSDESKVAQSSANVCDQEIESNSNKNPTRRDELILRFTREVYQRFIEKQPILFDIHSSSEIIEDQQSSTTEMQIDLVEENEKEEVSTFKKNRTFFVWTQAEEDELKKPIHTKEEWELVASKLKRTVNACKNRRQILKNADSKLKKQSHTLHKWKQKDIDRLIEFIKARTNRDEIASQMEMTTDQISGYIRRLRKSHPELNQYMQTPNNNLKVCWTPDLDNKLTALVDDYGTGWGMWPIIANKMGMEQGVVERRWRKIKKTIEKDNLPT